MFMGQYTHNLDTKGRVIVPNAFRAELGEKVVVAKWLDGCLALYTKEQWEKMYEQLTTLPSTMRESRIYVRTMMASALECDFDKQGRILLSQPLIKAAKIEKSCIFVGVGDHIELWSEEEWNKFTSETGDMFEAVAEKLTEFIR